MARKPIVTTTGTGATDDWVGVSPGEYVASVEWADSPGVAKIQSRALDGSEAWQDLLSPSLDELSIESNISFIVPGNSEYRLNVTTHTSAATLRIRKVRD